uniref:Family 19 chitinase n=1 Tax=Streptomyces plicatus TaxID=1922 RepID=F8WK20_STRPL|nr:Family 19 chitinase [Streptomyces plicatus]
MLRRVMGLRDALDTIVAMGVILPAITAAAAAWTAPSGASSVHTRRGTGSNSGQNWSGKWCTRIATTGLAAVYTALGLCGVAGARDPGMEPKSLVNAAACTQMFPNRNSFYSYSGLTAALSAYPGFANTGSDTVKKQEAAAFLANVSHETGGLVHIVEQNTANYPHYCDWNQPYGCPAGQAAYYGRGPIQLSWNFNYKAAGDALGIDLLNNPWLVQNDSAVAWKTALWYWNTQSGPGSMTGHNAMVNGAGFDQTIRSINGSLECDGCRAAHVQSRLWIFNHLSQILGVSPGSNLYC